MITDFLINILLAVPNALLDSMETLSITIPDGVFSGLSNIFGCLGFVCPMGLLMPILVIDVSLSLFQIAWALIIRIKSFIPTMGA